MSEQHRLDFLREYTAQLTKRVLENTNNEYAAYQAPTIIAGNFGNIRLPRATIEGTAEKMVQSCRIGNVSISTSPALKATLKTLGITPNLKSMREFLTAP